VEGKMLLRIIATMLLLLFATFSQLQADEEVEEVEEIEEVEPAETTVNDTDGWVQMDNGLKYRIVQEGIGEAAQKGNLVTVHYTGTLSNGMQFDSSVERGKPYEFVLGTGYVLQGWDLGVEGMKVGEKRTLQIPSPLAYGTLSVGGRIPANSDLTFEVELINIKK
jgi:FKBP-type peptidyl-prolyl cis-trans isomerase